MSNKLDDLIIKFKEENNTLGERIAYAMKEYLSDFTYTLQSSVDAELKSSNKTVNKIYNMMINSSLEADYSAQHIYPLIMDKEFNILSSEKDDKTVLEKINSGIRICQNYKDLQSWVYNYRIPVGFIYVEATKEELMSLYNNNKYILNAIDKDGQEHELTYYMIWSSLAVSKCKKMWKLSQLYKDETPIVFAPYAKRLFSIYVDVKEISSIKGIQIQSINFRLKNNNLEKYFLLDQELAWNVRIEDQLEVTKLVSPLSDVKHWKYNVKDLTSNQYIIPKNFSCPIFRIDYFSEKEISFEFESEYEGSFERVSIYECTEKDINPKLIYLPRYNLKNYEKLIRVRSIAEAYYEIKKFELPSMIEFLGVQEIKPEGKIIYEKYPVEMTIYDKGRFGYKNTNRLYIQFECKGNSKIISDYIEFVLGYLTFCFPEIGWEGAV